jgi:hypothetical protein
MKKKRFIALTPVEEQNDQTQPKEHGGKLKKRNYFSF